MLSNHPRIRVGLYIAALASQVASFFVAVSNSDLAGAFASTANLLSIAAGVTALANIYPNAEVSE